MSKEKARIVKESKTGVTWEVPAYSDGKLVGWAKVTTYQTNEAGLAVARAQLTLGELEDLNRQKFTDAKNNLRRGTSALAALRALSKTNPKVESVIAGILKKAEAGELTDDFLKSIGA